MSQITHDQCQIYRIYFIKRKELREKPEEKRDRNSHNNFYESQHFS